MKQEFLMQQEEMNDLISINKNQSPVMKFGEYWSGLDLQEKINHYWKTLGGEYGFNHMTVEPSAKGKLYFLAEPSPIEIPKTQIEIEIEKYIGNSEGYLNHNIKQCLSRIITQLENCEYECEGGSLKMNVAFIALKKLASK